MSKERKELTHQRLSELFHYDPMSGTFARKYEPRKEETISHERLLQVLDFDPSTGTFFWKKKTGAKVVVGSDAGYDKVVGNGHVYRYIRVDSVAYIAGRLAWFYVHGRWPRLLNYKDGDQRNVAIDNLEEPSVAITSKANDYNYLRIDGVDYPAARVAWFWSHGEWPHGVLRFRDRDKRNLRLANLRDSAVEHSWGDITPDQHKHNERLNHYEKNRDRYRDRAFQEKYGITIADYRRMEQEQDGKCAICGKPETAERNGKPRILAVDHCHDTGKVRGLLCGKCNPMIGYADHSIVTLERAIDYLRRTDPK
jgi:Recombination endonuclease VII